MSDNALHKKNVSKDEKRQSSSEAIMENLELLVAELEELKVENAALKAKHELAEVERKWKENFFADFAEILSTRNDDLVAKQKETEKYTRQVNDGKWSVQISKIIGATWAMMHAVASFDREFDRVQYIQVIEGTEVHLMKYLEDFKKVDQTFAILRILNLQDMQLSATLTLEELTKGLPGARGAGEKPASYFEMALRNIIEEATALYNHRRDCVDRAVLSLSTLHHPESALPRDLMELRKKFRKTVVSQTKVIKACASRLGIDLRANEDMSRLLARERHAKEDTARLMEPATSRSL